MRWAGAGKELWRVRVDLFAERAGFGRREIDAVAKTLRSLISEGDGDKATDRGHIGVDQGDGAAGRPVIGVLFWVRADDVGMAASSAVEIARRAVEGHGAGPDLYDVTVIPRNAVVFPDERSPRNEQYPRMPD